MHVELTPHPLPDLAWIVTQWPDGLAGSTPAWLPELLHLDTQGSWSTDDAVRAAVRDLLRHGGFKPTGRSKPSSEYLRGAAAEGRLTAINAAVDAANVVSLHSGLPISVVDLDRTTLPLRVELGALSARYVFNAAGQEIDVQGLLCLCDAHGPCANAVKDAQRTKTHAGTRQTLTILWGSNALPGRTARARQWLGQLFDRLGGQSQSS